MDERIKRILMEDCEMSEAEIAITSKREALEANDYKVLENIGSQLQAVIDSQVE